ncbi:hypothetical protein [Amycolatopsis alkalitolerans]|uniref:Uncharacterized protein n=1 Tax=Amycolatopsis alkalitolerans TaxID=2547244 RepID=A0A5C4M6H9_9PSEU|nr:hypothetical protein [Amycolatopsis alkalitolerans]TNC28453.1 hypothetical protein FG385_04005 [Amycolatopsis alkalitolerans]
MGFGVDPEALRRAHDLLRGGPELGHSAPAAPDGGDMSGRLAHLLAALSGAAAVFATEVGAAGDQVASARAGYVTTDDETAAGLHGAGVE